MMIFRKLMKLLRGSAAPYQVFFACILGSLIGFMPGFSQAPGLIVGLTLVLILLNASFFLAALTGLAAGLVSLALLPVSFHLGRVLLDGPTQGLFQSMINAPVLALFGFEYYAATGAIPLAIVFGALVAMLVVKGLALFRARMAALEDGSERYKRFTSKKWVRVVTWILAGGGPKAGYKALLESKAKFKPLRPLGVAAVVGVVVLGVIVQMFASGPIVTAAVQAGLERANGATVDLRRAELDLRRGSMVIEGLAMADPNALDTDIFRAERLEASVSVTDLLRKRLALDTVVAREASSGEPRRVRGARTRSAPRPSPAEDELGEDERTLEHYIEEAEQWRERLAQARGWLEYLMGPGEPPRTEEQRRTLRERLARRVEELGYAHVRAEHLVTDAPSFLVRHMQAAGVRVSQLEDETVDVQAWNVSTHAHLVDEPPRVRIESSRGTVLAGLSLDGVAAGGGGRANRVELRLIGLPGDRVGRALRAGGTQPLSDGEVDVVSEGSFSREGIDLPLHVTLHDATLSVPGVAPYQASRLELPLGVRGRLDAPIITLDGQELADALLRAGADQLAGYVEEAYGRARERVDEEADRVRQRAEQEAERARDETTERAREQIRRGLGGLLGGEEEDEEAVD